MPRCPPAREACDPPGPLCRAVYIGSPTRIISETSADEAGPERDFTLRMDLSRQVLSVPLRRLENAGVHRILSVLTDDILT